MEIKSFNINIWDYSNLNHQIEGVNEGIIEILPDKIPYLTRTITFIICLTFSLTDTKRDNPEVIIRVNDEIGEELLSTSPINHKLEVPINDIEGETGGKTTVNEKSFPHAGYYYVTLNINKIEMKKITILIGEPQRK